MDGLSSLLDTSVVIGGHGPSDADLGTGWSLSVITVGELEAGVLLARGSKVRAQRLRRLGAALAVAPVLPVDAFVAARYGELRAATKRVPSNDLWIAATALAHDLVLVTRDEQQAALPLVRTLFVS